MTFDDGGVFTVTENGEVLAEETYTPKSTTLELVPRSGAIVCAETDTYEKVEGDTLTFTVVEDQCADSNEGLVEIRS